MAYGNIYVAKVAIGASPVQTVKAFVEAESYPGPSLIIAYSHCIAHGIDMTYGYQEQKKAVECGHWPLYRFNPLLKKEGKNPLQLDSKPPTLKLEDYIYGETRYKALQKLNPQAAAELLELAKSDVADKYALMEQLSKLQCNPNKQ
jgi:pyruvate-ferredoxin/flavodoxin oxidoreductase